MSLKLRNVAALPLLTLVAWLARAGLPPTASIQVSPSNPTAGQTVHLHDSSADGNDGFFWTFGDGQSGQSAAVAHSWAEPGTYTVHLTAPGASAETPVVVSAADTLRLNAAHPFEVTVEVTDPDTGKKSAGRAYAQNDKYGFFGFPGITGDPESPEVSVKILEAGWVGRYWILWGSMTSLDFRLTVRDVGTGQVQIYRKEGTAPTGGFDTSSFPFVPTPTSGGPIPPAQDWTMSARLPLVTVPPRIGTGKQITRDPGIPGSSPTQTQAVPPTLTNTPPPNTTKTSTPTRTKTPLPSSTPTITPTPTITQTPTITPTPAPPFVKMQVVQWQWNFYVDGVPTNPGSEITFQVGKTYTVLIVNGDSPDVTVFHGFGGEPAIGLPRISMIEQGMSYGPFTITPMIAGDYPFNCTATSCGDPAQHESMLGVFHVVP
jgi:hypothetical protein